MESNTTVYSVRPTAKKEVVSISLEDNSITLQSDRGKYTSINYDQIASINVFLFDESSYSCTISSKSKAKIKFLSHTFEGFGNIVEKTNEFKGFIIKLQEKTKPYFSQITFSQGSSLLFYIFLVLLIVFVSLTGFLAFAIISGHRHLQFFAYFAGCLIVTLKIIMHLRNGKSKTYRPENNERPF